MDINKEKCKYLKKVRKALADKLGLDLHQTECTYEGKCSGTCPKCRQEEKILNTAILKRGTLAIAATATAVTLTGCDSDAVTPGKIIDALRQAGNKETVELSGEVPDDNFVLEGDVPYIPESTVSDPDTESAKTDSSEPESVNIENIEQFELSGDVPYDGC